MRIIGGLHSGRIIQAPANLPVRPTTDFAKTGLFNILQHRYRFEDLQVLDIFCGTGNISYEFASRGAASVISVDKEFKCSDFVKKQTALLKFSQVKVLNVDVFQFLKRLNGQFDIVFADPPFDNKRDFELIDLIFESNALKEDGVFILEHESSRNYAQHCNIKESRNYGKVAFSFFASH
ncbi:MAG: RsmD family RNA methyltransferase [Bacteroidia bacterium]|nr:RsmD family RNA methyltransferase [Bacteroidia bacterium]MCZ2248096.1 RsmD family RNA methyltransferase [Bacteroidia bacterium]